MHLKHVPARVTPKSDRARVREALLFCSNLTLLGNKSDQLNR
ncbi:hypothetical protein NIES2104_42040 [Leptolyngbya sp. NIES-2104]|nr:hypothetical protein NIES2104_42040 [Leptolyngbya sp. NIES-2104]